MILCTNTYRAFLGGCLIALLAGPPGRAESVHDAARGGDLAQVKALVAKDRKLLNDPFKPQRVTKSSSQEIGFTPLHFAARGGHLALLKWLLEQGADARAKDTWERTALHLALSGGKSERETEAFVDLLLKHKADENAKELLYRYTPLHKAAAWGQLGAVRRMLAHKGDTNNRDVNLLTPLHHAVWNGHKAVAEELLKHGAKVDTVAACGLGRKGHVERYLKDEPTLVNARDSRGVSLLQWAIAGDQKAIAELLLSRGFLLYKDWGGPEDTSLHLAVRRKRQPLIALLLKHGAVADALGRYGETPLHEAVRMGDFGIVKLLLANGANVNTLSREAFQGGIGMSRFGNAYEGPVAEVAEDVPSPEEAPTRQIRQRTPLHLAAELGLTEIAKTLLEKGANMDGRDQSRATPLFEAARKGHQKVVRLLLAHKANVNAVNRDGETPLAAAVAAKQTEIAKLLRKHGAKLEVPKAPDAKVEEGPGK
jgi:ankyrin repeat protein